MVCPLSFLVLCLHQWEVPKRIVHRNELSIRGKANICLTIWIFCLLTSKSPNDIGHERILRKNWHKSLGFGFFCEEKDWYTLLLGKSEKRMPALVTSWQGEGRRQYRKQAALQHFEEPGGMSYLGLWGCHCGSAGLICAVDRGTKLRQEWKETGQKAGPTVCEPT